MLRIGAVTTLLVGASYFVLGGGDYSRTVDRTPDQVANALGDLDLTQQPGAPGSNAEDAAYAKPVFQHQRTSEGMVWKVMSGDKVATTMTAYLTPVDGGKRTKVTVGVERGDAPDDFVSPPFRSEALTTGLFAMAIEDELNELVEPPAGNLAECKKLYGQLEQKLSEEGRRTQGGSNASMGDRAKLSMMLNAYHAELRRKGCMHYNNGELVAADDGGDNAEYDGTPDRFDAASFDRLDEHDRSFGEPMAE